MVVREMKAGDVSIRNFAKEDYLDLETGVFSGSNFIRRSVLKDFFWASQSPALVGRLMFQSFNV